MVKGWTRFGLFLRGLFRPAETEREMEEELRAHIQERAEDLERSGLSKSQAERQARIEFGGYQRFKEECREAERSRLMENVVQDARYGLRMLRKNPGFAVVAVATLALGIGANTAIFSVVNSLLLEPLPYKDSSRIVAVFERNPHHPNMHNTVSPANFLDWEAQNHVFAGMACLGDRRVNLTGSGVPEQVVMEYASPNFFDLLGVKPALGHGFTAANGQTGNDNVAVLSYGLWRDRFGSDASIVGRSIQLDGKSATVIGVAPRDFDLFIAEGALTNAHAQLWVPLAFPPESHDRTKVGRFLTVVARLKEGATLGQAKAEMDVIAAGLAAKYPYYNGRWGATVVPIREEISGPIRPALLVLSGAVAFVLLIACANVSSLLLSRATARRREMALRATLGASRWRIARQLLTESVLLAAAGGGLGIFLAVWGTNALLRASPQNLLELDHVSPSGAMLAFTAVVTLAAAILFGFLPSYGMAHTGIAEGLQESGRGASASRRSSAIRSVFVVSEIALALVLLAGSGLLVRSFVRLIGVSPGFNPQGVLTFKVSLPATKYKTDASCIAFYSGFLEKIRQIPGVVSVSDENLPPFSGFALLGVATDVTLPGQEAVPQAQRPGAAVRVVGTDYLRTIGIPLLDGREFLPSELAEERHVVMVNETFVRNYFPGTNPLGQKITIDMKDTNVPSEIVGVIGDVHGAELSAEPWPTVYWPYPELTYSAMTILVKTKVAPLSIVPTVRHILTGIDKDEPIANVATMDQLIAKSVARQRFMMFLLALFASVAAALASIGIYGVVSYVVAQRTNEIGVRIALGAQKWSLLRMVLGQGAKMALLGVGIGTAAGLLLTRFMTSLLYEVSATDPVIFGGVALMLVVVALAACYVPARRAMKVDPMEALRYE